MRNRLEVSAPLITVGVGGLLDQGARPRAQARAAASFSWDEGWERPGPGSGESGLLAAETASRHHRGQAPDALTPAPVTLGYDSEQQ